MNHNHNVSASDVFGSSADIELNSLHDAEEKLADTGSIHTYEPDGFTASTEEKLAETGFTHSNDPGTFTAASTSKGAVTVNARATDYDVFWTENDPENPMNWPGKTKWGMLILISVFTFITPLASSMFAPGVLDVEHDLHFSSSILGGLVVSVYILGYAAGPLIVAPCSEIYGRVPVYHATNVLFVIFTICCAESRSVGMLVAFRFLAGSVGSTPLVLGGGSIADTTPAEQRAGIMSIWAMGPLLGPVIGPVAGGFLAGRVGWRWVFYVLAIAAGITTLLGFFLLKETFGPVLLEKRAARLRKETGDPLYRSRLQQPGTTKDLFLRAIVRPFKLLFLSPICSIFSIYLAVIYGYLYLLFTTISGVYIQDYHWQQDISGLAYLGIGLGMFSGLMVFGIMAKRIQAQHAGEPHKPEWRLPPMIPGAIAIPIGLFLYGWSAEKQVQWIVPLIGTALVGFGLICTFMPISTYLVDTFLIYAASATAANTVLRSLVGALLPLAGGPLYEKLGLGWGNSLLAFIALAMVPLPFAFITWGEHIREKYKVEL